MPEAPTRTRRKPKPPAPAARPDAIGELLRALTASEDPLISRWAARLTAGDSDSAIAVAPQSRAEET
jgi:hypothetical protein